MGWSTPATWVAGTVVTASDMNTYIRDNQRYLKGIGQVPTIESGLTIDNTDGDERLLLPLLSTAECTTVLNAEGEVAFDEQTHRIKMYNGSAVGSAVTTIDVDDTPVDSATTDPISSNWAYDHVAAADPHTGYVLESLADAAGDIFYATADNTWARLAKGTAYYVLRMNSGATAPEWGAASFQGYLINKTTVNYNDSSPVTLFTANAGTLILGVVVNVTTLFAGTSPTLDIGTAANDDGYGDTTVIIPTSSGWKNAFPSSAGNNAAYADALVTAWPDGDGTENKGYRPGLLTAQTPVIATIGGASLTQGIAVVYVIYVDLSVVV